MSESEETVAACDDIGALPRLVGDFELLERLASHADSRDAVYKATRPLASPGSGTDRAGQSQRERNHCVAVRCTLLDATGVDVDELQREVVDVQLLRHDNLMPMLQSFVQADALYTVMPYMSYGSVLQLVERHYAFGLPEAAVAFVMRDVLEALCYMHSQRYIHRSVRCSHVLVEAAGDGGGGRCRLSGLRHCVNLTGTATRHGGGGSEAVHKLGAALGNDLMWLAPEVLRQDMNGYGTLSDVYSAGVAMCEMANGFPPFADMEPMQMLYEKMRGTTPKLLDSTTLPADEEHEAALVQRSFSAHMHSLADIALRSDPAERWSAEQLLTQHVFFKTLRKSKQTLIGALNL